MNNSNKKILVVDDSETNRVFLEEFLSKIYHYQVLCAEDGESAIVLAQRESPALILLDVSMPGMDGFEVCTALKKIPSVEKIPVIFLTCRSNSKDKIAAFFSGGVDYMTRPFDNDELIQRIQTHLDIYQLRVSLERISESRFRELDDIKKALSQANAFLKQDVPHKQVLSSLEEGVIELDQRGVCLFANAAAARLLGYDSPEVLIGCVVYCKVRSIEKCSDPVVHNKDMFHKPVCNKDEIWMRADGSAFPVEYRTRPFQKEGCPTLAVINFSDISIRKTMENKIQALAYQDGLTGLPNRVVFFEALRQCIDRFNKYQTNFGIFMLDMDHFKEVNDSMGHLAGDEVLRQMATRLRNCVPSQDKVARLSGDEFVFIYSGFSRINDVRQMAKKIQGVLNKPYEYRNMPLNSRVSMGIYIYNNINTSTEDCMMRADLALYQVKKKFRGGFYIFEDQMLSNLEAEIEISKDFVGLLERDELFVEFQPQFDLRTGGYVGAEALVRWNHPSRGCLLPSDFLPVAEKRGYIKEISDWVLQQSVKQISTWRQQSLKFGWVSINICASQVMCDGFEERVKGICQQFEIQPSDLVLELTETVKFQTHRSIHKALKSLSELGVRFAIDDFGTGYSSMKLLKDLHCDQIKIDHGFIEGIEYDPKCPGIIKALIGLAKALNLEIIAEGVENENQAKFLLENGCYIAQGFLYSGALKSSQMAAQYFQEAVVEP